MNEAAILLRCGRGGVRGGRAFKGSPPWAPLPPCETPTVRAFARGDSVGLEAVAPWGHAGLSWFSVASAYSGLDKPPLNPENGAVPSRLIFKTMHANACHVLFARGARLSWLMNLLKIISIFLAAAVVPTFGEEISIRFPHRVFEQRWPIRIDLLEGQQNPMVVWPYKRSLLEEGSVVAFYRVPDGVVGSAVIRCEEGNLISSGFYWLSELGGNRGPLEFSTPNHFGMIEVKAFSPFEEMPTYNKGLDYCLRLFALDSEGLVDPFFLASAGVDPKASFAKLHLGFAKAGRYLVQIASTSGNLVLFQRSINVLPGHLVDYKSGETLLSSKSLKPVVVEFERKDVWRGWNRVGTRDP